jgi:hypothetical protein
MQATGRCRRPGVETGRYRRQGDIGREIQETGGHRRHGNTRDIKKQETSINRRQGDAENRGIQQTAICR